MKPGTTPADLHRIPDATAVHASVAVPVVNLPASVRIGFDADPC